MGRPFDVTELRRPAPSRRGGEDILERVVGCGDALLFQDRADVVHGDAHHRESPHHVCSILHV